MMADNLQTKIENPKSIWRAFHSIPLLSGLLTKAFFDALSDGESVGTNVWSIVALFVGVAAGRIFTLYYGLVSWSDFWYSVETLLKKNMLRWIVSKPGARKLKGSAGDAVST